MHKIPLVVFVADNLVADILNEKSGSCYDSPGKIQGVNYPTFTYDCAGAAHRFLVHPLTEGISLAIDSTAVGQAWTLVFLVPEGTHWEIGSDTYRAVRRWVLDDDNEVGGCYKIEGPWTIKGFAVAYPDLADTHFRLFTEDEEGEPVPGELYCPHVFVGDSPEALAIADYSPSDADCLNDVKPVAEDIFGPLPEEEEPE